MLPYLIQTGEGDTEDKNWKNKVIMLYIQISCCKDKGNSLWQRTRVQTHILWVSFFKYFKN
jgi:hypothetical protein